MLLLILFPNINFDQVSSKILNTHYEKDKVAILLSDMDCFANNLVNPSLRVSLGVRLLLAYMKKDLALYQAMIKNGIERTIAEKLIEEITWAIFEDVCRVSYRLTRLISADPGRRLKMINDLLWFIVFTYPFNRVKRDGDADVGFDVNKCPLADFFSRIKCLELCTFSVCKLDYRLAELWHSELNRTQTIASGGDCCDFKFNVK